MPRWSFWRGQRLKVVYTLKTPLGAAAAFWQLDRTFPFGGGAAAARFAKGVHIRLSAEEGEHHNKLGAVDTW